jgi:hypothetical protein
MGCNPQVIVHHASVLMILAPKVMCATLFGCAGKGVTIYVLDSGIRVSHQEFQSWDGSSSPNRITVGPDFVDKDGVGEAGPP